MVHGFKYHRMIGLHELFATLLLDYFSSHAITFPKESLMVPIPLHTQRERIRGFNQSALVARKISQALGISYGMDILVRARNTKPQISLRRSERLQNIQGAFVVRNPELVRGKRIILFDDVATSGATIEEAAKTLKSAGAKKVWAVTIAH